MTRRWIWLQRLLAWTFIWALFVILLLTAHPNLGLLPAVFVAFRMIVAAAVLSLLVQQLTRLLPWPRPVRPGFVAVHLVAAGLFAFAWLVLNSLQESLFRRHVVLEV